MPKLSTVADVAVPLTCLVTVGLPLISSVAVQVMVYPDTVSAADGAVHEMARLRGCPATREYCTFVGKQELGYLREQHEIPSMSEQISQDPQA